MLPSVDAILRGPDGAVLIERFGRHATTDAIRDTLADLRQQRQFDTALIAVIDRAADQLARLFATGQRPVFNLTGTVLHTNLGRAPIPPEAAQAAAAAMSHATSLEFDLSTGKRGQRDSRVAELLCRLTGAEAATMVNNNAAAVLLMLNTLARGREVAVSRGELIEIGGAFRIPDVMTSAGAILREVGTTNRTHPKDFRAAFGPDLAAIMHVHQANYAITGFTASVAPADLATIAHEAGVPMLDDLGSGSLVDLARWGLPHERTPQESLADGADLVSFSGDKLLGGPQAGLIVGRADLIKQLDANPMKRALRLDKGRLAALEAVLRLYLDPDRLAERLVSLRLLTRPEADIAATAARILPVLAAIFPTLRAETACCSSQIGSGAMPVDLLPSRAVTLTGPGLDGVAAWLRKRSRPIIGRIADDRLWLDCRCLESDEEAEFISVVAGRM